MLIVPAILYRRPPLFLKNFFSQPGSAINLAVFRITLFGAILTVFSSHELFYFSSLPRELLFPPLGTGWLVPFLPISPAFATTISVLFIFAAALALIGCFTRVTTVLTTLLGLYALGIPQLYGKMNHYHHLIWFAAILAASPCSDALSVDSLRQSWRRRILPKYAPNPVSVSYSIPLRLIWILLGTMYFWAGLWKLWTGGLRWAFSDNLKFIMYDKWLELGGWLPMFRIDRYPLAYHWGAAFSMMFELSFLVLILFPRSRPIAVLSGLAFHNSTGLFMKIYFSQLQICYAAFVNWVTVFRRAGQRLFRDELIVIYDGDRDRCRRAVSSLQQIDLFARIRYEDGREHLGAPPCDFVVQVGERRWIGADAYRNIVYRLPLLWPTLPLLYFPPAVWIGQRLYHLAFESRSTAVVAPQTRESRNESWRPAAFVGAALIYVAVLCSIAKINSWPFSTYPSFEDLTLIPEANVIVADAESPRGAVHQNLLLNRWLPRMPPERYHGMLNHILGIVNGRDREERLNAFWREAQRERPDLRSLCGVRLYSEIVSTIPAEWNAPATRRTLLATFGNCPQ